jgi:ankyrin repeat protein
VFLNILKANPPVPLYFHLLPSDINDIVAHYVIKNYDIASIDTLCTLYKDYNIPYHHSLCTKEVKSFLQNKPGLSAIHAPLALPPMDNKDYFNILTLKAVLSNNASMANILLFAGANVEYAHLTLNYGIDKCSYTLLSRAAELGYTKMIQLLLHHGANPNPNKTVQNNLNQRILASPLVCALSGNTRNTRDIVKLLLDAGAEKNIPDARGQTPLSFLIAHPHLENAKRARELLANNKKR